MGWIVLNPVIYTVNTTVARIFQWCVPEKLSMNQTSVSCTCSFLRKFFLGVLRECKFLNTSVPNVDSFIIVICGKTFFPPIVAVFTSSCVKTWIFIIVGNIWMEFVLECRKLLRTKEFEEFRNRSFGVASFDYWTDLIYTNYWLRIQINHKRYTSSTNVGARAGSKVFTLLCI